MTSKLPLEVLGLMSPILCWVEGSSEMRYPERWGGTQLSFDERERAWLVRELPTYSFDNLDEIRKMARESARLSDRTEIGRRLREHRHEHSTPVAPPEGYFLPKVFRSLADRYFEWRGSDLYIQQGRLEELHELALRFPVPHLIRHSHASAIAAGLLSEERALELSEQVSHLHTTSRSFRTLMNRGVSECHMHLWGVLNPDEVWADHLFRQLTPGSLAKFSDQDRRLLILSRFAVSLMSLAILAMKMMPPEKHPRFRLLSLLDQLYLVQHRYSEKQLVRELSEELRKIYTSTRMRELGNEDGEAGKGRRLRPGERSTIRLPRHELAWLLRLASPVTHRFELHRRRQDDPGPWSKRPHEEGVQDRLCLLERLHLTVQEVLLEPIREVRPALRSEEAWISNRDRRQEMSREFLHQVYYRYLIYQTHHWRLGTQSGRTTGLRHFQPHMLARQRDTLVQNRIELQGVILDRLAKTGSLKILEGRIGPPRGPDDLTPWLLGYARAEERGELEGFGLVVHFKKADLGTTESRTRHVANRVIRYGRIRRITRENAFRLYRLLSRSHPAVPFIVGIDAANLELTTPPEVFAPAFRFLRKFPIEPRIPTTPWHRFGTHFEVSSLLRERKLGLTYHVGEDFRHLLSGTRAIAEVLEFLAPRPGDRLGHAIALAIDPEVWFRQTGYQAILPKLEWLDTLVWVYNLLSPSETIVGELNLRDRIQRLARDIYGHCELPGSRRLRRRVKKLERLHEEDLEEHAFDPRDPQLERDWSPLTLHHAWKLRQLDPHSLNLHGALQGRPEIQERIGTGAQRKRWTHIQRQVLRKVDREAGSRAAYHLLSLYWLHEAVRSEGNKIHKVDMSTEKDLWLELCHQVQEKMKDRVARRELVVEVNPSSNRMVGPLGGFEHHHVFNLTLNEDRRLDPRLRVTVNTDDPGVFNTSLPHEFYLLGEVLKDRWKVPEPEVERWLEWLRQNGMDSSFVHYLPDNDDPRIGKILESLRDAHGRLIELMSGSRRNQHFWRQLDARRQELRRRELRESLRLRPHLLDEIERRLAVSK